MLTADYLIPERNIGIVLAKFAKLVKRAAKLGIAPLPELEHFHAACEKIMVRVNGEDESPALYKPMIRNWHRVILTAQPLVLSGWRFVATMAWTTEGNILSSVPGECVPEQYRTADSRCDHCGKRRQRNETYILVHEASQLTAQVGANCLKDYLGNDPHKMMSWAEALGAFSAWGMTDGTRYGQDDGEELEFFLSVTSWIIRHMGWVSRKVAGERGITATVETVLDWISTTLPAKRRAEIVSACAGERGPGEADIALAGLAAAWAVAVEPADDYLHNLRVVARLGAVTGKTSGIAASMVAAYKRATEQQVKRDGWRERDAGSRHVGVVGKRLVAVTLHLEKNIEIGGNEFGPRCMMKLRDADDNILIWFTSPASDFVSTWAEGEERAVSASVREHSVRDGVQQTIVTRVSWPPAAKVKKLAQLELEAK